MAPTVILVYLAVGLRPVEKVSDRKSDGLLFSSDHERDVRKSPIAMSTSFVSGIQSRQGSKSARGRTLSRTLITTSISFQTCMKKGHYFSITCSGKDVCSTAILTHGTI